MSNLTESGALGSSFDSKDYVEATTDAAKRTRTVTIILVVASVLVAIGYYNSLQWSWARHRVKRAYSQQYKENIKRFIDPEGKLDLTTEGLKEKTLVDKYQDDFQTATARSYVENIRFVRAPFFGIAFDVNDLGIIGGLALIIILLLMRYSLSREIKNLNVAFREAVHHDQLSLFYHALAMRQVFTVPHMKGEDHNRLLATSPKFICVLPIVVFTLGVAYDYYSILIAGQYSFKEVFVWLLLETAWLIIIVVLSLKCWERQSHINSIWDQHWNRIQDQRSSVIRLDKDLIEEFGSDEAANQALRTLQVKSSENPITV